MVKLIKNHYPRIICEIMSENGIAPWISRSGRHIVISDASFTTVVQHTEAFLTERLNDQSHYRYDRYMGVLQQNLELGVRRVAHIDIGCGAGLFSWTFLDWATQNRVKHNRIDLYGYDHSPQMIRLATGIREKLIQVIPSYPNLRYTHSFESLLSLLTSRNTDTDYIVTFGHVLAQSNVPSDIQIFAKIIHHIMKVKTPRSTCELIATDAVNWNSHFNASWNALLEELRKHNVYAGNESDQFIFPGYAVLRYDDIPW